MILQVVSVVALTSLLRRASAAGSVDSRKQLQEVGFSGSSVCRTPISKYNHMLIRSQRDASVVLFVFRKFVPRKFAMKQIGWALFVVIFLGSGSYRSRAG